MAEYIIIIILLILSLVLFTINIKQKNETVDFIKESQSGFLRNLEHIITLSKLEQEKVYLEERKKIKQKNDQVKEYKIKQLISKILRELEVEGISSIILSGHNPMVNYYDLKAEEFIFVSYDSKEEMYDTLVFDKKNFNNKFKVSIGMNELKKDFLHHWDDRVVIEEVVKNKIKKILADKLMNELDGNNKEEDVISRANGHNPGSRRQKQISFPVAAKTTKMPNLPRKPRASGPRTI